MCHSAALDPRCCNRCRGLFCLSCIKRWLATLRQRESPASCPQCRASLHPSRLRPPPPALAARLDGLPTPCGACGATLPRAQLPAHTATACPAAPARCGACWAQLPQSQLAGHTASTACPRRRLACPFAPLGCEAQPTPEGLAAHLLDPPGCSFEPLTCGACGTAVLRWQAEAHLWSPGPGGCPAHRPCAYRVFGCAVVTPNARQLATHQAGCSYAPAGSHVVWAPSALDGGGGAGAAEVGQGRGAAHMGIRAANQPLPLVCRPPEAWPWAQDSAAEAAPPAAQAAEPQPPDQPGEGAMVEPSPSVGKPQGGTATAASAVRWAPAFVRLLPEPLLGPELQPSPALEAAVQVRRRTPLGGRCAQHSRALRRQGRACREDHGPRVRALATKHMRHGSPQALVARLDAAAGEPSAGTGAGQPPQLASSSGALGGRAGDAADAEMGEADEAPQARQAPALPPLLPGCVSDVLAAAASVLPDTAAGGDGWAGAAERVAAALAGGEALVARAERPLSWAPSQPPIPRSQDTVGGVPAALLCVRLRPGCCARANGPEVSPGLWRPTLQRLPLLAAGHGPAAAALAGCVRRSRTAVQQVTTLRTTLSARPQSFASPSPAPCPAVPPSPRTAALPRHAVPFRDELEAEGGAQAGAARRRPPPLFADGLARPRRGGPDAALMERYGGEDQSVMDLPGGALGLIRGLFFLRGACLRGPWSRGRQSHGPKGSALAWQPQPPPALPALPAPPLLPSPAGW